MFCTWMGQSGSQVLYDAESPDSHMTEQRFDAAAVMGGSYLVPTSLSGKFI